MALQLESQLLNSSGDVAEQAADAEEAGRDEEIARDENEESLRRHEEAVGGWLEDDAGWRIISD